LFLAFQPDKCIKQCSLAIPKCMWSPQSQKMMWQIPNIPSLEVSKADETEGENKSGEANRKNK
jgi:hypothetical protein